jgi:Ca-activated chloride channel family protein
MNSYDKLPLLKKSFGMLVETLDENDRVSIVTYAGSSDVVLDSENGANKDEILDAINDLDAGGSTAGANGILTAYELAEDNFIEGGNNRVILASDGDFNVGISDVNDLERLIADKRDSGVYLSILGFGTGNIRDDIMETLATNGNGNYSYINDGNTANKVLVDELGTNLFTIADDVKAQVEFNPNNVESYRLIGYENRQLENRDFEDDTKDAGEIGIGTDVVVLFELTLTDPSDYKYEESAPPEDFSDELFEVRIRYKNPGENESNLMLSPVLKADIAENMSSDYRFAATVAAFGHKLRGSQHAQNVSAADMIGWAESSVARDENGYRRDFVNTLKTYRGIAE